MVEPPINELSFGLPFKRASRYHRQTAYGGRVARCTLRLFAYFIGGPPNSD